MKLKDLKIGDKLKCNKQINNLFGWELFEKDKVYEILNIDENYIVLDHNLYANEYAEQPFDFVNKNFTKII
jgi:hypothetical protein